MSLAVAAYVLAVAVFIPVSGWFADRLAPGGFSSPALAVFTLGSVLCGMAQNFTMLVAMRVLQGLGGAMMTPVGRLILLRSFPRSELMTAMTYMTLPADHRAGDRPAAGRVADHLSVLALDLLCQPALRPDRHRAGAAFCRNIRDRNRYGKFDFPGFLMVGGGLGLLQFGLENVSRPVVSLPHDCRPRSSRRSPCCWASGFYARTARHRRSI